MNAESSNAIDRLDAIIERLEVADPSLFLDYDGTLTPIVQAPDAAVLSDAMRSTVRRLAGEYPVAIVSGRDVRDVRQRVGVDEAAYAGSHGFEIVRPGESTIVTPVEQGDVLDRISAAERQLRASLNGIDGHLIEPKKYSLAVHYRNVAPSDVSAVEAAVDRVLENRAGLRKTTGKKVFDIQPDIDWDKGRAVDWLLDEFNLDPPASVPVYIGDDVTDEDAFRALRGRGIGIAVLDEPRKTEAAYYLESVAEVKAFLQKLDGRLN